MIKINLKQQRDQLPDKFDNKWQKRNLKLYTFGPCKKYEKENYSHYLNVKLIISVKVCI